MGNRIDKPLALEVEYFLVRTRDCIPVRLFLNPVDAYDYASKNGGLRVEKTGAIADRIKIKKVLYVVVVDGTNVDPDDWPYSITDSSSYLRCKRGFDIYYEHRHCYIDSVELYNRTEIKSTIYEATYETSEGSWRIELMGKEDQAV